MMKKIIFSNWKRIIFALVICISRLVFSQENKYEKWSFTMHSNYVLKAFNISCKMPENFTDLKYMEVLKIRKDNYRMDPYFPVIQSDNKECILMYHFIPHYGFSTSDLIKGEIKWMLGINCCDCSNTDTINIKKYATFISGNYARDMFNADSVIFMDIQLESAYKEKYTYCTSMFITKKAHATMILKWFFTEAGMKDKNKYIKNLSKNIWYNDGAWTFDSEKSYAPIEGFLEPHILDKYK